MHRDRTGGGAVAPSARFVLAGVCAAAAAFAASTARADVETSYTVTLQTDLRYTVGRKTATERIPASERNRLPWLRGQTHREVVLVPRGFSRNENFARFKVTAEVSRFKGVAELDFVWVGYSRKLESLPDLTIREKVDPFRVEAHALYLDIAGLFTKKLDVRIGQQVITWGTADQFNPTSNLNPLDLEDVLLFGERIAVPAVRADLGLNKDWTLSVAWVPIFKPHHLPETAPLALSTPDRIPMVSFAMRWRFAVERYLGEMLAGGPTRITEARPIMPERNIQNSQAGARLTGKVGKQDISLSYFYGHSGTPQPTLSMASLDDQTGIIDTKVQLVYPKMHVVGFDMAGQIPWAKAIRNRHPKLKPVGWWVEIAAFFPQRITMASYQSNFPIVPDGEYDYDNNGIPGGPRPAIVESTPFLKWAVGVDYSFTESWYANVQWIHGFPEEFGAGGWLADLWADTKGTVVGKAMLEPGASPLFCSPTTGGNPAECIREFYRPRIGDYIVAGIDFKFYKASMLARLFLILDLRGVYEEGWDAAAGRRKKKLHHLFSKNGFSMVIYPQYTWSMGHGAELSFGGYFPLGKRHTKFGDPAVGGAQIWGRAKFAF